MKTQHLIPILFLAALFSVASCASHSSSAGHRNGVTKMTREEALSFGTNHLGPIYFASPPMAGDYYDVTFYDGLWFVIAYQTNTRAGPNVPVMVGAVHFRDSDRVILPSNTY
jgi:hypothetical protein